MNHRLPLMGSSQWHTRRAGTSPSSLINKTIDRSNSIPNNMTMANTMLLLTAFSARTVLSFSPHTPSMKFSVTASRSSVGADQDNSKALFDPLGLYTSDAPERIQNKIEPLESNAMESPAVRDPLGLYKDREQVDDDVPMSMSLPFLAQPRMLDGTVPGDRGFDPFNFSRDASSLQWYRTAEVKHARLAMLAAAGWPLAELLDRKLAFLFNLRPLLVFQDRVPSVLNGGLDRTPAIFWAAVLGTAFAIESVGIFKEEAANRKNVPYTPGDLGFDPLGLAGNTVEERKFMAEAELFNGRLAMMAITSFALQEWWSENSIINQFPIFFKPIWAALEQLQDQAGNGL